MLCVAGHVNKPGIYEVPLGMNMKKFIYEMAGGIPNGKKLKAVIPGGSSCPLLKADEIDIPMDYDSVAKAGSMLGSGGMVVMDEDTCMVDMARRIMHFYAHESCGWCIPCREGTTLAAQDAGALPRGIRPAGRHRPGRRPGEKYAGPHLLPARRRRGAADHQHRRPSGATNLRIT